MEDFKAQIKANASDTVIWCVTLTVVGVLVGLGKIKPETLEYILFAVAGYAGSKSGSKSLPSGGQG